MKHVVTAVMIVAKSPSSRGGERYLHRGDVLPPDVPAAERERLVAAGLVKAVGESTAAGPRTSQGESDQHGEGERDTAGEPTGKSEVVPTGKPAVAGKTAGTPATKQ